MKLYTRYGYKEGKHVISRFRDGEKRRNRLFIDGCIIRKIRPDIRFLELLYNLVHRVYFYYDNSDGVLSDMLLIRKAYDVMNYDVESMVFESLDAGRVTTSPGYCKLHNLQRRAYGQVAAKMERYAAIREWYNPELSVIKNHKLAIEAGRDISLSTLKRYCEFMKIATSPQKVDIASWYFPHLPVKKNLFYAKISHIKTSQSALYKYCKDNGINPKGTADPFAKVRPSFWKE